MIFHVVSLPHTQTTREYSSCAYTQKVVGFCRMMQERGHVVFLYSGEHNEAACHEHVTCITEEERAASLAGAHYTKGGFDPRSLYWRAFNGSVIAEVARRTQPRDFICLIGGHAQRPVADAFPGLQSVEFGVGYGGWFSRYRVFESHAWRHACYGARAPGGDASAVDGEWFDDVIPGYLDPADFPLRTEPDDYFLYVGRMIERKGYRIAQDVCQHLGVRLLLAGPERDPGGYGEYVGVVGPEDRARLMGGARALFAPTLYLEPFGNVVVEAQACGTPAITSNWGAFTETVEHGRTGFRCRTLREFVDAAIAATSLDRDYIHRRAVSLYSLDAVGAQYEAYFERLLTLWGDGWRQM